MTKIFHETVCCLLRMQWEFMPIKLSEQTGDFTCEEVILSIDLNKLAYVCYIEKLNSTHGVLEINEFLNERREVVIREATEFASQILGPNDYEFLTLYIVTDEKKPWLQLLPKPNNDAVSTFFYYEELKYIANSEEPDPLILWKFSKAYTELVNETEVITESNLSIFAVFRDNEDCIWVEDRERPDDAIFRLALATMYKKRCDEKRNEHIVAFSVDGSIKDITVYNYCDYAPFYREIGDLNYETILLEDFPRPIWFINLQRETHHPQFIISQLEMLAFWLLVLGPDIEKDFDILLENNPLIVNVTLDSRYKVEMRPGDVPPEVPLSSIHIPVLVRVSNISVTIPVDLAHWYAKSDNQGERHVIFHFLKAIIKSKKGNTDEKIKSMIDTRIPIGNAKMSSILANANNIMMESRYLPTYRPIKQYDLSEIRVNLTRTYGINVTSDSLNTKEVRITLCWEIVAVLKKQLISLLKEFDAMMLLPFLLDRHEVCVQRKAILPLDLPARIALFGYDQEFILKHFSKEQERAKTALSLRCLIELIVAYNTVDGNKAVNYGDSDKLVALMSEIIAWATLADGIHLELYDPKIELLSCGRIKVDYDSINTKMFPFGFAKTEIDFNQYDSAYNDLFDLKGMRDVDSNSEEVKEIDQAFLQEFGITFFRLHDFLIELVNFTRSGEGSTLGIDEQVLFEELKGNNFKLTNSEIKAALNALTLLQGWDIEDPTAGYRKKDTQPWHYNRALSLIRRPIAKLIKNGQTYYFWSYRHLFASFENIFLLLVNGVLWSPENGATSQLSTKYANKKGDVFREEVYTWMKENSDFEVIEKEIPIKPSREIDHGDIDILAVDHERKIFYSIECKNTSESKSIYDFKTDLDHYLKPDGKKKYIEKHKKRDEWLKTNPQKLKEYGKDTETYKIISLLITAFEAPFAYTHACPLPILSFQRLKIEGIQALKNLG